MITKSLGLRLSLIAAVCSFAVAGLAQQTAAGASTSTSTNDTVVPRLVNYSSTLADWNGKPLTSWVGVTFSLYKDSQGGAPLWMETQNVQSSKSGHYSVMLGCTTSEGLPEDVFVSGEARWLGVQVQGQDEQPRVLLVAVPYALKAHDAETVGGLPPSAFMLAPQTNSSLSPVSAAAPATSSTVAPPSSGAVTGTGKVGYLPLWDTTSDIISSGLFQSNVGGTARIGINNTTPVSALDVKGSVTVRGTLSLSATATATAAKGANSQGSALVASVFNSGTNSAINQTFGWQAEPAGNDTSTPSATLNLLFGAGPSKPAETGLYISSNGLINFATGQTFPGTGTGTVTSVGSGAGLTGGPITGSGSLSIASAGVTNGMLQNSSITVSPTGPLTGGGAVALGGSTSLGLVSCASGQILKWSGSWACAADANSGGTVTSVASGTGLTGGPITSSGTLSVNTAVVPELALANTFTNTQAVIAGTKGTVLSVNNTFTAGADISVTGGNVGFEASGQSFPVSVGTTVGPEAVYAENDGTTLGDAGVLGATFGTSGSLRGVFGWNSNSNYGAGVYGQMSPGNSLVEGGWTGFGAGVWGDGGNSPAYAGVLGTADNSSAGVFYNNGPNFFTVYISAGSTGGYPFGAYNSANGNKGCGIDPNGNFSCTGSKNAVVPIDGGKRKVALAAIESPKNWFEDFGSEHLSNGVAVIQLEPDYAQTINTKLEYHVFLTPNGDCKGLYVTRKTESSFEVRELGGGTSSIGFDYRVVALRKDYENVRLADHTNDPDPSKMPTISSTPTNLDMKRMIAPKALVGHPLVQQAAD